MSQAILPYRGFVVFFLDRVLACYMALVHVQSFKVIVFIYLPMVS